MIKILIVSVRYVKGSTGGAAKSFMNIFKGLKKTKNFKIKVFMRTSSKLMQKLLDPLGISYFLYFFKIYRTIKKFKPNIIVTQSRIAFSATLAAKLASVPIITLVRDVSDICPKHIDIINYGLACQGLTSKKICYNCINYWRSLRVLIGNKPRGWQDSTRAMLSTFLYKIRYFLCKLNLKLLNHASIVLVASELMKNILIKNIEPQKIKIANITPIITKSIIIYPKKKNQFLFVIPSYEASHKGLDFILKLSKFIPKSNMIIIVGGKIPFAKFEKFKNKIVNYDHVSKRELEDLYQNSQITLVPSFCTEAFGRIIIESFINKTPVISSPNCGANSFFKNKDFLKVIPIKLDLWLKQVNFMIKNPIEINDDDLYEVSSRFSMEKSLKDFSILIKKLAD